MARCRDCGTTDVAWRDEPPGMIDRDSGNDHWLTCKAPSAVRRRRRKGLEPGILPMSVSRLTDWRACRYRYQQKYLTPSYVKEQGTPLMVQGRVAHRLAAALLYDEPLPELPIPLELAVDWPQLKAGVEAYVARVDKEKVVGVEEAITMTWRQGEITVEFECRLDRLDIDEDLATVVDYKTGWGLPSEEEMRHDVQLLTYGTAARHAYPAVRRVKGEVVAFRLEGRTLSTMWTAEELDAFAAALRAEVAEIATATSYPPNPMCTVCPVGTHPVAMPTVAGIGLEGGAGMGFRVAPVETPEQAANVAIGLQQVSAIMAAVNAQLRQWARQHGPVLLPDGSGYGYWYSANRHMTDIKAAIEALQAAGKDPNEFVKFDFQAGAALVGGGRKAVEALSLLIEEQPDFTWGYRKDAAAAMAKVQAALEKAQKKMEKQLASSTEVAK